MEGFLMKYIIRDHSRGFTLIEVMIAVVILAVGLLGLAKFQSELTRSAAATKDRAAALALAEKKIEDLRAFTQIEIPVDSSGNDIAWSATTNQTDSVVMAYDYIADNQGGRLDSGAQADYVTGSGEQLTLNWTLEPAPIAGAQEVLVTVAWTDQEDQQQSVQLTEIISEVNPGVGSPVSGETGSDFDDPQIIYTPGIAPEVVNIDVDTGDGLKKETSKPLPDVFHNADYNKVTFDVVTYNSLNSNEIVRRESFTTVNCLCTASTGDSLTPAYTVFENGSKTIHDVEGTLVTKNTGVPANNLQPEECNTCCRDHTDPSTVPTDALGAAISYGTVNYTASGDYPEICRMKYINGKLRVYQDWQLKTVTTFIDDYVADSSPATQGYYRNYVVAYAKDNLTSKASLIDRDTSIVTGGNQQLLARAIYIDTVYNASNSAPSYADFIATKIAENSGAGATDTLQFIPFFEINLTKLANWSASNCTASGGTGACVTNDDIVDEGLTENNYSRGLATVAANADYLTPATSFLTAQLNAGNSGVVGETNNASGASDGITVTVADSSTFYNITVKVDLCSITGQGNSARKDALFALVSQSGNVSFNGGSSGNCSLTSSSNNDRTFTCSAIPNTSTVDVTVSGPTTVTYNNTHTGITNLTTDVVDVTICDY